MTFTTIGEPGRLEGEWLGRMRFRWATAWLWSMAAGCGALSNGGPVPLTFGAADSSGTAGAQGDGSDTDGATGAQTATEGPPTSAGDETALDPTPGDGSVGPVSATGGMTTGTGDEAGTTAATDGNPPGDSSGSALPLAPTLYQAAFNDATETYQFGYMSLDEIPIVDAPDDVDWDRWAMLHDGEYYRLYFLPTGSEDDVYQFAFNEDTDAYEYGYMSLPSIPITGAPAGIDPSSFAMLHDGSTYRLYFLAAAAPPRVYQFGFDPDEDEYVYGYDSTTQLPITGSPIGTDWAGWGMLFDGQYYRIYAFSSAAHDAVAQFAYNPADGEYQYGYQSIDVIDLEDIPPMATTDQLAMLHDGSYYRMYLLGG